MGWSPTLTWLRWGPKYQLHRKVLQPPFVKSKVAQYTALQRREALRFCLGAIDHPEDWLTAVRRFSVSIVLKIAYGIEVEGRDSQWIKLAGDTAHAVGKSGAPASSIMDRVPASEFADGVGGFDFGSGYGRLMVCCDSSISTGLASVHGKAAVCSYVAADDSESHQTAFRGDVED